MTLRQGLLLAAAVSLIGAVVLVVFGSGGVRGIGVYLAVEAAVLLAFVLLERYRYRPRAKNPSALRPTNERMIDPVSGQLVEVWEDPATGAREYRPVAEGGRSPGE